MKDGIGMKVLKQIIRIVCEAIHALLSLAQVNVQTACYGDIKEVDECDWQCCYIWCRSVFRLPSHAQRPHKVDFITKLGHALASACRCSTRRRQSLNAMQKLAHRIA
jgi:hypothetical protein